MRYFVFNLEKTPVYHVSGRHVDDVPRNHLQRTLLDYELFFVSEGELYIAQEKEFCVKKGEILLQNKGQWQGGTRDCVQSLYWVHFDGDITLCSTLAQAQALCEGKEKWIFFPEHFSLQNPDRVALMLSELNHYQFEQDDTLVKEFLLSALFAELAFQYAQNARPYVTDKRFSEIVGYLSVHIGEDVSVAELAERFSYNPKYLSSLFRKFTGLTVKEYITQQRMRIAKRLLVSGSAPIKQVAHEVGYADEYYFMRVFKTEVGMSPKTYRKTFCGCHYT